MRLFIAMNFDQNVIQQLITIQNQLKTRLTGGNVSRSENLHLTLAFLGEVKEVRLPALKQLLSTIDSPCFPLVLNGLGRFPRDSGDTWWLGIEPSLTLTNLHRQVINLLKNNGFPVDARKYKPHLTLIRQAYKPANFDPFHFALKYPSISAGITHISLMKSEQIRGRLTYTELYRIPLNQL